MKLYIPHYLDASVVVKLVAREPGSDRIRSYLQTNRTYEFYITEFALYEVLGVLKRKWLKKGNKRSGVFRSRRALGRPSEGADSCRPGF